MEKSLLVEPHRMQMKKGDHDLNSGGALQNTLSTLALSSGESL